jgi:ribosomal protein S12 methylthiotransferase
MPSVAFITLGCAKNEVDTDSMRAQVLACGHSLTNDPAAADAVVVNTCAFITEATEEAIATILEAAALPRVASGETRLIVAGCLVSRYQGARLAAMLPEVAAFLSVNEEQGLAALLAPAAAAPGCQSAVEKCGPDAGTKTSRLPGTQAQAAPSAHAAPAAAAPAPLRTVSAPWAYLKIAEGCDRFCSFCTIPFIRGHYRSRPVEGIIAEATELVEGGVRELVLIAQDTGRWGREALPRECEEGGEPGEPREARRPASLEEPAFLHPSQPENLAQLLALLARLFPDVWLRVMYLQPAGITDELLATMAAHDNICRYLDLPLQHASARVLADMNREGSGEEYLALLARIREALPDVVLRTTVIAGFPGETRAEARELERFIARADFDYVGVFPYSQEEGTPAGSRLDQVPRKTRLARAQRLRDLADARGFARASAWVGSCVEVLITERDEGEWDEGAWGRTAHGGAVWDEGERAEAWGSEAHDPYPLLGRTKGQAPEVDGMVHLDAGSVGQRVFARIQEAYCYELDGRVGDV